MSRTARESEKNKRAFLAAYAKCGSITEASNLAKIDRNRSAKWRKEDPEFLAAFEEAHEEACQRVEEEMRRRAVDGYDKPVFQGGKQVGVIREYSDTLLIFYAKGLMPDKYRERQSIEHSGGMRHEHRGEVQVLRSEMLNEPEYLEFQRQRALIADSHACLVRANGESRAVEDGKAPGNPGPSTNGHSNGRH